jgi:TctA family transporter
MLGSATEEAFFQSIQIARGSYAIFYERPISLALGLITISAVAMTFYRSFRRKH